MRFCLAVVLLAALACLPTVGEAEIERMRKLLEEVTLTSFLPRTLRAPSSFDFGAVLT
jgi:hypothetical protein